MTLPDSNMLPIPPYSMIPMVNDVNVPLWWVLRGLLRSHDQCLCASYYQFLFKKYLFVYLFRCIRSYLWHEGLVAPWFVGSSFHSQG